MKKTMYLLAIALLAFTACDDDPEDPIVLPSGDVYIDASSRTTWHYYSFDQESVIGTGEEDSASNAAWFARNDWDIAIKRYYIRTNSGAATSISAQGGVYTCAETETFESVTSVPANATFEVDQEFTINGHGGSSEIVKSTAQVIQFQLDGEGNMVMPPVYLPSPIYVFKTANGAQKYKVNFTQYKNSDGDSGHVKFDFAQIN